MFKNFINIKQEPNYPLIEAWSQYSRII